MIKAISALAFAALMAAALTVLPGFTPDVKASVPATLAKGDKLPVHPMKLSCAEQSWPKVDASCLRQVDSNASIRQVRMVTTDRS